MSRHYCDACFSNSGNIWWVHQPLINSHQKEKHHNILSFVTLSLFALPSLIKSFNMIDINHDDNLHFRSTTNQQSKIGVRGWYDTTQGDGV
jgi:heme/copper-type cytochrome/quinol oxidase subunit 1